MVVKPVTVPVKLAIVTVARLSVVVSPNRRSRASDTEWLQWWPPPRNTNKNKDRDREEHKGRERQKKNKRRREGRKKRQKGKGKTEGAEAKRGAEGSSQLGVAQRSTGGQVGARARESERKGTPCARNPPSSLTARCPLRSRFLHSGVSLALRLAAFLPCALSRCTSLSAYSLGRSRVRALTRSAYVMGARWSPSLGYRISMPIRLRPVRTEATAVAEPSTLGTAAGVVIAAAPAARLSAGTSWLLSSSSLSKSQVLGCDHGGAPILIRSYSTDTSWGWRGCFLAKSSLARTCTAPRTALSSLASSSSLRSLREPSCRPLAQ